MKECFMILLGIGQSANSNLVIVAALGVIMLVAMLITFRAEIKSEDYCKILYIKNIRIKEMDGCKWIQIDVVEMAENDVAETNGKRRYLSIEMDNELDMKRFVELDLSSGNVIEAIGKKYLASNEVYLDAFRFYKAEDEIVEFKVALKC